MIERIIELASHAHAAAYMAAASGPAHTQAAGGTPGGITLTPDATGPGGALLAKVLNWTVFYGLAGAIMSILIGGGVWGISAHFGNGMQAGKGRGLVIGGAIGSAVIGLVGVITNTLFNAA
jgi:hypothetical protein